MTKGLVPLLIASAGASVIGLMFFLNTPIVLALPFVIGAAGYGMQMVAKSKAADDPVGSLPWFDWSVLGPYALAVGGTALLILVAVWLSPPEKKDAATATPTPSASVAPSPTPGTTQSPIVDVFKPPTAFVSLGDLMGPFLVETVKVVSGALAAFITLRLIKSAEDGDAWVGGAVKKSFTAAFAEKVKSTPARPAIYDDDWKDRGWGSKMRRVRAEAIANQLGLPKRS